MAAFLPSLIVITPYLPERRRHPRACQELNLHEELEAGCFLSGHPRILEPVGNATLGFGEDRVYLFATSPTPLGSVHYGSIVSVAVETHEAVTKRFSEARLMFLGHRLLAFRSRETADGSYVVVEWENGQAGEGRPAQRHDGIFCFEGLAADQRARRVRDAILHYAALHRRASGVRVHSAFSHWLDEFEARCCEHCGKVHRPRTSQKSAA